MFVYKFENIITHEVYIGKWENSLDQLFARYEKEIKDIKNKRHIINALRKYTLNCFKFEILKDLIEDRIVLKNLEIHFISFYNSYKKGYNQTIGGDGQFGFHHSFETKQKISRLFKGENHPLYGKKVSDETRLKISLAHTGKKLSEETKKKIGTSQIGRVGPMLNKHHSEQAKTKISIASNGENNPMFRHEITYEKILALKENNKTNFEISFILGCSKGLIYKRIKEYEKRFNSTN